ncbi:MAG: FliH/SctL family protein [Terracidiphilus sp.]
MSSSPSRAPIPSPGLAPARTEPPEAVPFPYDEVASEGGHGLSGFSPAGKAGPGAAKSANQLLDLETQSRALGREQGELEARKKFEEQLARERAAIAAALAEFAEERAIYYQKIEGEAVQLALSIARKILHREAQVDPLLLMGIVRVALEQIEGATGVVLAVSPQHSGEWRRYLASCMDPKDLPQIVDDATLAVERCELRTSMGVAQLGVEVQLKEIEQGFADLLAARPGQKG